jgi:hypothetical protein
MILIIKKKVPPLKPETEKQYFNMNILLSLLVVVSVVVVIASPG